MCDELKEELEIGKELAEKLLHHLLDMGAGKATIPVITTFDGNVVFGKVVVTIDK